MSGRSDSGDDSCADLAPGSTAVSRDGSHVAAMNKSALRRNDTSEVLGPAYAADRVVVESEQMGFRLAREITHLRDRLSKWKEQCASLEMRLSSSETQCQSLQTKLAASEADRQERGQELERARLLRAALDKEKEISERELSTAAALNRDILKAKDDEISHLKAKLVDTKDQSNALRAQMQAEQVRYVSIENEALDRAKSTETRLRARCARLASSMSDLKSEAHTRDCEFSELIKAREELNAIVMGYKSRAAVMEQEENSRLSEISRLQSLLRESSISLAQSNIELAEKDRAMARTQRTADELQSTVRGLEDQKLSVERQLRESIQEVAHLRSISDTATHQADDIVSRSKEGERKAQRELAAERYRSEVAVSEANEKCAEMQRKLQKEFSVRLYQAEEAKHALELELNAAKRAIDALTVKSARSLTESRTLSSDALCRAEGQLEAALKRAAKYERLYNVESAGRKQAIAEQTAKQLENQQLSSSGEIIRLQCQMSTASERLIQFEEANRSLVSRLENAERENEKLSRLQENLEQTLSSKVKDSRLSEVLGSRISDMRQQLSGAIEMLEKVRIDKALADQNLREARSSKLHLKQKYDYLKHCNRDLLLTIKKYEKICVENKNASCHDCMSGLHSAD